MSNNSNRRDFIVKTSSTAAAVAVSVPLAACGGGETSSAPAPALPPAPSASVFAFGVASGDPLADRVILWTHAKIPDSARNVDLTWQVAADASFAIIIKSGRIQASETTTFTAKVDVTGLTAGSNYVCRFIDGAGVVSRPANLATLPCLPVAPRFQPTISSASVTTARVTRFTNQTATCRTCTPKCPG